MPLADDTIGLISRTRLLFNIATPSAVALFGLYCLAAAALNRRPPFLNIAKHPATVWTAALWLVWWLSVTAAYLSFLVNWTHYRVIMIILDAGDLMLLGAALLYCSGNNGISKKRLLLFPVTLGFLLVLYLIDSLTFSAGDSLFSTILVCQSAVLASIASLSVGYMFHVRWRSDSSFVFLFLAVGYSMLQVPAYLYVFLLKPHVIPLLAGPPPTFAHAGVQSLGSMLNFERLFLLLAIGKLPMAIFPIAFFASTADGRPNMQNAKFFPTEEHEETSVPMDDRIRRWLKGLTVLIFTSLVAALVKRFVDWYLSRPAP